MKIQNKEYRTIWYEENVVKIIDQTKLPHQFIIKDLKTIKDAVNAIKVMEVRGAPLIGGTAAYGMALAVQESNDAVFTFHSYADVSIFYDGDNIFAPTSVIADLYVDGTKVFDINGSYSYDMGNATPIPININTALTFNPFSITITAQRITSKEFEADISITDNSGCLTTLHGDLKIKHDDYENLEETDIVEINTIFKHQNMEIKGYMEGSLLGYNDPSNTQINAMTDVDIYYSNSKIGELILQSNSNNDNMVYIVYLDGSSENADTYYDPFITNIEQILFPFMGGWD